MQITMNDIYNSLPLIGLLFVSGGMGSFVVGLIQKPERELRYFKEKIEIGFIGDILIGGVTSIGIFFFIGSIFSYSQDTVKIGDLYILKIMSLGILSGVAGINLLTKLSRKLENELVDLKEEIKSGTNRSLLQESNFRADDLLKDEPQEALKIYNEILLQDKDNEHALIGKARAFRWLKKEGSKNGYLEEAILILKKVVINNPSAMRAHYNMACYMNISDKYTPSEVLVALGNAIRISKSYIALAKDDEDLNGISETEEFKKLEQDILKNG